MVVCCDNGNLLGGRVFWGLPIDDRIGCLAGLGAVGQRHRQAIALVAFDSQSDSLIALRSGEANNSI